MARMTAQQRAKRIEVVIKRDGSQCVWCSTTLSARHADATVDHALPYAKDGSNRAVNLLLACTTCNHKRGTRQLLRFAVTMRKRGFTVQQALIEDAVGRIEHDPLCLRSVCSADNKRRRTKAAEERAANPSSSSRRRSRGGRKRSASSKRTTAPQTRTTAPKRRPARRRPAVKRNLQLSSNGRRAQLGALGIEMAEEFAWAEAAWAQAA